VGLLFFRQALVSRGSTALRFSPYIGSFLRDCLVLKREIPRFTAFYNGLSTVKKGSFAILNSPFEQINYGLFARILDFFQARDRNRERGLPYWKFRCRERLAWRNIKRLIATMLPQRLFIPCIYTSRHSPDYLTPFGLGTRGCITAFARHLVVTPSIALGLSPYIDSLARY
jgi:hypothetical protein